MTSGTQNRRIIAFTNSENWLGHSNFINLFNIDVRLKLAFVSTDSLIDHQKQGRGTIIPKDLPSAIEQPSRGS